MLVASDECNTCSNENEWPIIIICANNAHTCDHNTVNWHVSARVSLARCRGLFIAISYRLLRVWWYPLFTFSDFDNEISYFVMWLPIIVVMMTVMTAQVFKLTNLSEFE